jgi:hypothetical protein
MRKSGEIGQPAAEFQPDQIQGGIMKKTVWTFGLIAGGILSVMMLITMPFHDAIGFDRGLIVGYTTMVAAFLLIFFGIRSYRDNAKGGTVSFGRAFVVGTLIAAIASVCYVATWEVLYFTVMPDFMEKYEGHVLAKAKADGATQAELDKTSAEMRKFAEQYKNPVINVAYTFVEPFPVGLVIALVSAGVLSRRRGRRVAAAAVSAA